MVSLQRKFAKYVPLVFLLAAPEASAIQCYEYNETAAAINCGDKIGKSADFTVGCDYTPPMIEQKEVPCPFQWVNTNGQETHAQVCAGVGMKTTSVGDEVCSSGERRASNTYNFMYGKWGGVGSTGGDHTTARTFTNGNTEHGGARPDQDVTYQYCWTQGQKKDYDATDIVTAFPCSGK